MTQNNPGLKNRLPFFDSKIYFLLGLAICFRLPGIDAVLASDELAMVSLWSQMPYEKIFQNYQYPNNHIFLTIILSFLLKNFGLYEWLLRVPTLFCGILSVLLGYRAGKEFGKEAAVITAFFLALSEWHIFFSTNARGYLVIMLLAQICFLKLGNRLEADPNATRYDFSFPKALLGFSGWILMWTVGSWTLPTFLFFELSLALYLSGLFIFLGAINKTADFLVPFLSLLMGLVIFYLQYYFWISPEMLESAKFNAAKTPFDSFFKQVMFHWLAPFDSIKFIFLLSSFAGGWALWKQSPLKLFLLLSILLGPILAGVFGFILELIPGMPHARTYFYLQPFFIILVAIGISTCTGFLKNHLEGKFGKTRNKIITGSAGGITAFVFLVIASLNTYQENYLQRLDRIPLKKVLQFTNSLNSNDLFIVPDDLHVEFYLYGANEMRSRAENILREGKIDKIYFLEYYRDKVSSFIRSTDGKHINMSGYPGLVNNAVNRFPGLPQQALIEINRFGPFGIHQVKPGWLKKRGTWKGNPETIGVIGEKFFQWDTEPRIKFVDTFLVAVKKKQLNASDSLVLNLMNISGSDLDFSAEVLEGNMLDKQIKYNPAWRINGWTMDHPYGTSIFNRTWNPAISLSSGSSAVSVLDVHFFKKNKAGMIKDFLSYEISMPEGAVNPGESKT